MAQLQPGADPGAPAVHAKGGGAFGVFEVTEDVSQYTKAAVFQPGAKTDTADPRSRPWPASGAVRRHRGATRGASR